jgi:hypothetical protein
MKMIRQSENDNIRLESSFVLKNETLSKRIRRSSLSRRHQHWNSSNSPLLRLLLLALILIVCDMHPKSMCPMIVLAANNDDYYGDDGAADDSVAATDDANAADGGDAAEEDGADADQNDESENVVQSDDKFGFQSSGFGSVSVMPTSCIT